LAPFTHDLATIAVCRIQGLHASPSSGFRAWFVGKSLQRRIAGAQFFEFVLERLQAGDEVFLDPDRVDQAVEAAAHFVGNALGLPDGSAQVAEALVALDLAACAGAARVMVAECSWNRWMYLVL